MASRSKHSGPVRSYGTPTERPVPGETTRKRPRVGDKDPNYKPPKKEARKPRPKKPVAKKPKGPQAGAGSKFRDWRGTRGAIEDAER